MTSCQLSVGLGIYELRHRARSSGLKHIYPVGCNRYLVPAICIYHPLLHVLYSSPLASFPVHDPSFAANSHCASDTHITSRFLATVASFVLVHYAGNVWHVLPYLPLPPQRVQPPTLPRTCPSLPSLSLAPRPPLDTSHLLVTLSSLTPLEP